MQDIKQFYIDIKGDYNDALTRMMSDALILRMITKFINGNSVNDMISFYEKKDYRFLFSSAHTLKGVAGNLSLTPLYEIACVITEATRNSDGANLDQEIKQLKETYSLIKEAFDKYLI